MKITEKCKVIVASSLVAALMTGTALPALAASPAGDVPFAVLAQQNSAVTPEQVEALISQIGTVTRSRRAAIEAALDAYNQLDDAGKAAVTNFGVLAEAQQILGIQDALAKSYQTVKDILDPVEVSGKDAKKTGNEQSDSDLSEEDYDLQKLSDKERQAFDEEFSMQKEEKKVNHNEEILALHDKGYSILEISKMLEMGQGEVKFVLDMYA